MNEIKYEPLYGDQTLFDNAPVGTELVGHSGGFYKNSPDGPIYCGDCTFTTDEYRNIGFIAARRIIKEPKRWTVEDQKAGRPPEVGCNIVGKKTGINTVLFNNGDYIVTATKGHIVEKYTVDEVFEYFSPIETPEEKAERLRSEWVELAFDNMMRKEGLHSTECLDRMKCHFGSVYDALLSRTLSAPTKGGE